MTPASRFCGITGGQYAQTGESNTAAETGTCASSGEKCDADAYLEDLSARQVVRRSQSALWEAGVICPDHLPPSIPPDVSIDVT